MTRSLKLLLLGGTGDARQLALGLHRAGVDLLYSVAGLTTAIELPCRLRRGGFGGVDGLAAHLRQGGVDLRIDATHPYATRISANAALAAAATDVPLWGLRRPAWRPRAGDDWIEVADWEQAAAGLSAYRRPLITLGRTPLEHPRPVPAGACWSLRCLPGWQRPLPPGVELITATGPFSLDGELALLRERRCDLLVSKNSGGRATAAKLEACRQLRLPVMMLTCPVLPSLEREFAGVDAVIDALTHR